MRISRKLRILVNLFITFIIIGLLIRIYKLNNEIKNIKKLSFEETSLNNSIIRQEMKFNTYRVFFMPEECYYDINEENKYKAYVGLSVGNTEWKKSYVIISDSISSNGELLGKVDTFYTEDGIASIEKEYSTVGRKKLFGKYIVKFVESKEPTVLDFEYSPNIIDIKDSTGACEFFLNSYK